MVDDDKGFFPRYYAAPFVRRDLLEENPGIEASLDKLAGMITAPEMSALIGVALEKHLADEDFNSSASAQAKLAQIVKEFLQTKGVASKHEEHSSAQVQSAR